MKKLGQVVLRYLGVLVISTGLLVGLTILKMLPQIQNLTMETWRDHYAGLIRQTPFLVLPAATVITCFISFYQLTRLYRARWSGYFTLTALNCLSFALPILTRRFLLPDLNFLDERLATTPLFSLIVGYRGLLLWLDAIAGEAWWWLGPYLLAPALLTAACWPLTRLTRQRPIFGALLGPACCLGLFWLMSALASPSSQLLFKYIGLEWPVHRVASVLSGIVCIGLFLFDPLCAFPPRGGLKDE